MLITCVFDTGEKLINGVIATGDQFIAGVVVTGEHLSPSNLVPKRDKNAVTTTTTMYSNTGENDASGKVI